MAARAELPKTVALQGNLDLVLLDLTPPIVRREATRLLDDMKGQPGHIFNLGHGILPQAKIECVEALVDTVVNWRRWQPVATSVSKWRIGVSPLVHTRGYAEA